MAFQFYSAVSGPHCQGNVSRAAYPEVEALHMSRAVSISSAVLIVVLCICTFFGLCVFLLVKVLDKYYPDSALNAYNPLQTRFTDCEPLPRYRPCGFNDPDEWGSNSPIKRRRENYLPSWNSIKTVLARIVMPKERDVFRSLPACEYADPYAPPVEPVVKFDFYRYCKLLKFWKESGTADETKPLLPASPIVNKVPTVEVTPHYVERYRSWNDPLELWVTPEHIRAHRKRDLARLAIKEEAFYAKLDAEAAKAKAEKALRATAERKNKTANKWTLPPVRVHPRPRGAAIRADQRSPSRRAPTTPTRKHRTPIKNSQWPDRGPPPKMGTFSTKAPRVKAKTPSRILTPTSSMIRRAGPSDSPVPYAVQALFQPEPYRWKQTRNNKGAGTVKKPGYATLRRQRQAKLEQEEFDGLPRLDRDYKALAHAFYNGVNPDGVYFKQVGRK